jgi:hypothetical protein
VDGGESWELLQEKHAGPSCGVNVILFSPHPTDPSRVYRLAGCFREAPNGARLEHSADRGETWSYVTSSDLGTAAEVVGGQGPLPERYYLMANQPAGPDGRSGPVAHVYRGEGGLGDWMRVFSTSGGEMLRALAYDPQRPDLAYVGLSSGVVLATADAGASWAPLTDVPLGALYDLVVGVDGANLYAASEQGVWRYPLP